MNSSGNLYPGSISFNERNYWIIRNLKFAILNSNFLFTHFFLFLPLPVYFS